MRRRARIVVVGAGIGGLAAAGALRACGFEVDIYERAPDLGEVGAGLQLAPNAVKVLRALGIERELRPLACEPTNIVSVAAADARLRFREPLKAVSTAQFGAPYLTAHRADVHRLLQERLPASAIHLDRRCTGTASVDGAAVATFSDGARGRSRHRGRCRWHQFGGAGKPVRGPASPLHRANGLALHRADRLRPDQDRRRQIGRDRPRRIRGLDRPRWSRHLLSDPRRRALQHLRRPRFRAMDRGIVVGAEQPCRARRRLLRLERGVAGDARPRRAVLQVGHSRPRSAAPLDARPRHAARRRRPPDDADAGARSRHHARGRL